MTDDIQAELKQLVGIAKRTRRQLKKFVSWHEQKTQTPTENKTNQGMAAAGIWLSTAEGIAPERILNTRTNRRLFTQLKDCIDSLENFIESSTELEKSLKAGKRIKSKRVPFGVRVSRLKSCREDFNSISQGCQLATSDLRRQNTKTEHISEVLAALTSLSEALDECSVLAGQHDYPKRPEILSIREFWQRANIVEFAATSGIDLPDITLEKADTTYDEYLVGDHEALGRIGSEVEKLISNSAISTLQFLVSYVQHLYNNVWPEMGSGTSRVDPIAVNRAEILGQIFQQQRFVNTASRLAANQSSLGIDETYMFSTSEEITLRTFVGRLVNAHTDPSGTGSQNVLGFKAAVTVVCRQLERQPPWAEGPAANGNYTTIEPPTITDPFAYDAMTSNDLSYGPRRFYLS